MEQLDVDIEVVCICGFDDVVDGCAYVVIFNGVGKEPVFAMITVYYLPAPEMPICHY